MDSDNGFKLLSINQHNTHLHIPLRLRGHIVHLGECQKGRYRGRARENVSKKIEKVYYEVKHVCRIRREVCDAKRCMDKIVGK